MRLSAAARRLLLLGFRFKRNKRKIYFLPIFLCKILFLLFSENMRQAQFCRTARGAWKELATQGAATQPTLAMLVLFSLFVPVFSPCFSFI